MTGRCSLGCRHCSTRSEATSPQLPAPPLRRFVATFSAQDHPEFLLLTGGEPLLRPRLVRELADTARSAGTLSYLLTGAFFTKMARFPRDITAALESVDHVSVSIDSFHEERVPREQAFRALRAALDAGRDVSVQTCGTGPGDPYLADLTRHVRAEFGGQVPMFVTRLQAAGRALDWMTSGRPDPSARSASPAQSRAAGAPAISALPCELASWPVVGFDGTIVACCNADLIDAGIGNADRSNTTVPAHLRLGHIDSSTWPQVRQAVVSSPVLRELRTRGPLLLADRYGESDEPGRRSSTGPEYCRTCQSLSARPDVLRGAEADAARPQFALLEQQASALYREAGAVGFALRYGDPAWAELVLAGYPAATAVRAGRS
jgi:hypothetical protein